MRIDIPPNEPMGDRPLPNYIYVPRVDLKELKYTRELLKYSVITLIVITSLFIITLLCLI